jgi:NAD(P)-dependent dehydrogenase (short-subunit alcohol dehydrogenase family)
MQIEHSIALVTGANRGLGKAYVEALLAAGAAVVYAASRELQAVTIDDPRVVPVRLDITNDEQVRAATKTCRDVTLLVNNAGIMKSSAILADGAELALRAEMEVNVFGTLRMLRAFAPVLAANGGGAIANVLSVASWVAYPHNATYGASKHAALALTDAVRYPLKGKGIQVIGVFSGYIDTDMAAGVTLPKVSPRQVAERTLAAIREGRPQAYADERTEATRDAVRTDPEALHARIQALWDAAAI